MRATVEATLPHPPEELFDLIADIRNEARWHPDYRGATKLGQGPVGLGTSFDARYRGMGAMRVEITEYERPERLRFQALSRGIDMDARFSFASHEDGTALVIDVEGRPLGPLRLLRPVFGPIFRRETGKRPNQIRRALAAPSAAAHVEPS